MSKKRLIEMIEDMPDDLIYYYTEKNSDGVIDVRIFTERKDKEFLDWCFEP